MNIPSLFERAYTGVCRDAEISPCLQYRYVLKRWWSDEQDSPWACWIMLNPSTADAAIDDPTIRRCMGFCREWGVAGMYVVNLFAWRSPSPSEMKSAADPIGPENDWWIKHATSTAKGPIVAAWGVHGSHRGRDVAVCKMLASRGVKLQCLATSQGGMPRHPLYLSGKSKLIDYAPEVPCSP